MASGTRSIFKGSEEAFLYECDPCKYQNITSEAKAYCTVCNEYLCPRCEQAHKGTRTTRDHKILTGKDIPSVSITTKPNIPGCDTHKTMPLNIYCKDHDDVICGTCKITGHRKCVTTDVSDQKKHVRIAKSIDEAVKTLTDLKLQFDKMKQSRKSDKTKVTSQLGKCLEDMRNMRKHINLIFDKLERKFEKEVRETEEKIKKEMDDHVTIAEDALKQLSDQIKLLVDSKKSKNDDAMFVGMKKSIKLRDNYYLTLSTVQQTIYPIQIRFRAHNIIHDVIKQLNSIGSLDRLTHPSTSNQRTASLLEMSVVDKREIGVGTRGVCDCTFMKSGHLVLASGYVGLVLLDESFKVQSQLSVLSVGVAAINENEAIITQGEDQQLLRVRLFPQMDVMTTVKMDRWCYGVDVFNDEIYVGCYDGEDHGEVQVLNMDGKIQRKLGVNNCEYMFKWIHSIKVSRDGNKIFVSDEDADKVTCVNQDGHVMYQYSDTDLKGPCGLYVDEDDTLLVCGCNSNNIHMVGRDGRKVKVWLTDKDGMVGPLCVSYRPKGGCLGVGQLDADKPILAFSTKLSLE